MSASPPSTPITSSEPPSLPDCPPPSPRRSGRLYPLFGWFIPADVWANWRWDAVAGMSSGIYQGCIWTFALQLARGELRANGFQMGLAMAAPAIGYLFATFWARQMEGRSKLPFVTITWLIARGAFLATPLLVRGSHAREFFLFLLCASPILFSVSTPAYTAIMKDIYPDELRGRLMSYVRIGMAATMLITARIMGYWQEAGGLDYRWMFAIGGVFGAITAFAFSRLRVPPAPPDTEKPPLRAFLYDTLNVLRENHGFRWFSYSVFVTGFANLIATTLYPIYQVDVFHITPTQIATMQNIAGALSLFSLFFWGWFMDRFGSLTAVLVVVLINCLSPLLYAVGTNIQWLYLSSATMGIAMAGVDLAYLNTTLLFSQPGRAAQYQAIHSTFFGLRGTIAPLLAVPMLNAVGHRWTVAFWISFGIMVAGVLLHTLSLRSYRSAQRAEKRGRDAD